MSHKEQVSHGRNARPYPLSENLEVTCALEVRYASKFRLCDSIPVMKHTVKTKMSLPVIHITSGHFLGVDNQGPQAVNSWHLPQRQQQSGVMPRVRVPKTERIRRPQQCKSIKGFYCQLEPGLPSHPAQWSLDESPEPRFTAVFISLEQRQGVGKG